MANKTNAELSENFICLSNFCLCSRWIIGGVNCQWPFHFCSFSFWLHFFLVIYAPIMVEQTQSRSSSISITISIFIPTLTSSSNFKFQDFGCLWMQMLMMHFLSVGCRNCWKRQIENGSYKIETYGYICIGLSPHTYIFDLYYLSCQLIE